MTTPKHAQDMKVLAFVVQALDSEESQLRLPFEVEGLSEQQVRDSLRRLDSASPPYWAADYVEEQNLPYALRAVTERGLRDGGIWPTAESVVSQVADLLDRTSEQVGDEEQAGILRRAASVIGNAARDIAVGVATQQLGGM